MVSAGQGGMTGYVPLWCTSNYSFLEGSSFPEELVERTEELRLPALALVDRDGVYGVVRAHAAAKGRGVRLIIGSLVTMDDGSSIILYPQTRSGYANLCSLISRGRLRSPKGFSSVSWGELEEFSRDLLAILPTQGDVFFEKERLGAMSALFADRLYIGVSRHYEAVELTREMELRRLAEEHELPLVALPRILYHEPGRRRLQDVVTAIGNGVSLEEAGTLLRPNDSFALASIEEMERRYRDEPQLLSRTLEIAERCSFSLSEIVYRYPSQRLPKGYTTAQWLRELTWQGAVDRYPEGTPQEVQRQIHRELETIESLEYCGYFLTMWEIVAYCRREGILCQGRGSAANSVVCYVLGITAVDPVRMDLLFERFISKERAEPPDIDLDIEHRRREEVIQHVYESYGRSHAAMVANVVRFRSKSAVREVGKALCLPDTSCDRVARLLRHHGTDIREAVEEAGVDPDEPTWKLLIELSRQLLEAPRHLSIHPGGFLLGSEAVSTIVPVENATMPDRTVIQWDKYDVQEMGLFKVDLLGLGALTHLDYAFRVIEAHFGRTLSLARIPAGDQRVYQMIGNADTVGVFQLESRAQMAMLPRMRPREFYDLVVQISIVRPGPITGGMVHPYLRRRNGEEEVEYPHPALEPVLSKTLGVPLFQEQVMKLAVVAAGYTPGEADQLRRDMAAWRRSGRIEKHREKLIERMVEKGIAEAFAQQVFDQIRGFGEYGFPESHAASFALIAYATAWVRRHYPVVFTCALLNAWPMGFYSPGTLVSDLQRHGHRVLPVDLLYSDWECTLERLEEGSRPRERTPDGGYALRMGLRFVKGLSGDKAERILEAREEARRRGGFASVTDFVRRTGLDEESLASLARAGAFRSFRVDRRQALWEITGTARRLRRREEMVEMEEGRPIFRQLSAFDLVAWNYERSAHSTDAHPLEPFREQLRRQNLPDARGLAARKNGSRASYAGLIICRQRPETAGGTLFITLEDETGFVNLVVWKQVFKRFRTLLLTATFLGVTGTLQSHNNVVHLLVEQCWNPRLDRSPVETGSRDFR
ncbi:MAG: error-prone DNA polymerase [Alkalispirochaetaceae bacterium]